MSFSFIIPIYNDDINELNTCIKSIILQNLEDYEILLINDGSTNNEIEDECKKYELKNQSIKYFYQNNQGSAVARNLGLENASKDYIVFVDADDELESDFFNHIEKKDLGDISIFNYSYVDNNSSITYSLSNFKSNLREYKNDIYSNICFYPGKMNDFMFGSIWGKIFSAKYIKNNRIKFIPCLRKAQDRVFMLHLLEKTDDIRYYSILMYKYKFHHSSITHKMNFKMIEYYSYLYKEMIKFAQRNKFDDSIIKFLPYNILNELLLLTVFNINYKNKYFNKRKKLIWLIDKFNVNKSIKIIKYRDIPTKKGKIKLFFYKYKLYFLLYKFNYILQKKQNKKLFK